MSRAYPEMTVDSLLPVPSTMERVRPTYASSSQDTFRPKRRSSPKSTTGEVDIKTCEVQIEAGRCTQKTRRIRRCPCPRRWRGCGPRTHRPPRTRFVQSDNMVPNQPLVRYISKRAVPCCGALYPEITADLLVPAPQGNVALTRSSVSFTSKRQC